MTLEGPLRLDLMRQGDIPCSPDDESFLQGIIENLTGKGR